MNPANDNGPMGRAANDNLIPHARLLEFIHYDSDTGVFTWRVRKGNIRAGTRAGIVAVNGYRRIKIDGREYPEARLAWFYVTGKWPDAVVDHASRDILDNSFANLREATLAENQHNRSKQSNNTSGRKGVSQFKRTGRWRAEIMRHGKSHYLGSYATADEASAAYDEAALDLHGLFARNASGPLADNDNREREAVA
jgi:hypothetical protein